MNSLPPDVYALIQKYTGRHGITILAPIIDYYHDIIGQWTDADIKRAASEITARLSHVVAYFEESTDE